MEISRDLGEAILYAFPESGIKVDVHHPDVMVNVEVRNEIYVYSQIIPGAGGMPVGTNGSAMLLLSGGIDSPVAGYMVSKRGVSLEATYSCAAVYKRTCKTKSCGSCKESGKIFWTDQAACRQLYGYPALYLRSMPA